MPLLRLISGWTCLLVLAPLGWALPILPGTLFLIIGILLLSERYVWAGGMVSWAERRWPDAMQRVGLKLRAWRR